MAGSIICLRLQWQLSKSEYNKGESHIGAEMQSDFVRYYLASEHQNGEYLIALEKSNQA